MKTDAIKQCLDDLAKEIDTPAPIKVAAMLEALQIALVLVEALDRIATSMETRHDL